MDILLYAWIALTNAVFAFVASGMVGYLLYRYARKQGEDRYNMAKDEIRSYIKGEFLSDITEAVRQQLNGIMGPIGKAGSAEAHRPPPNTRNAIPRSPPS